ncbi:hypothetical protein [Arthrobacter sp. A5]|uniref:hypothetical protein n=1 Tax=Arthrobacter sp. A5 TaxID=576926 RepID=UPI003DA95326
MPAIEVEGTLTYATKFGPFTEKSAVAGILVIVVFLVTALGTTSMEPRIISPPTASLPRVIRAVFVAISTAGIIFSSLGFRQGH